MHSLHVSITTALARVTEAMNWKAASDAAAARRAELRLTQEQVIEQMGEIAIHIDAYRKFERNEQDNYRRTTLAAISQALGWPADALWSIAEGRTTPVVATEVTELRAEVEGLAATIAEIAAAVARLEEYVLRSGEESP